MGQPGWTFLSNHSHVLLCLARSPELRLREIAVLVGITERAVQKIVADLSQEGFLEIKRVGRRNRYSIAVEKELRHPIEEHRTVGDLISMVFDDS